MPRSVIRSSKSFQKLTLAIALACGTASVYAAHGIDIGDMNKSGAAANASWARRIGTAKIPYEQTSESKIHLYLCKHPCHTRKNMTLSYSAAAKQASTWLGLWPKRE